MLLDMGNTPVSPLALLGKGTLHVPSWGGDCVCEDIAASGFSLCHFVASDL